MRFKLAKEAKGGKKNHGMEFMLAAESNHPSHQQCLPMEAWTAHGRDRGVYPQLYAW